MAKLRWIKLAHLMPHVIWYCKFKETKPRKFNTYTSYRDLASKRPSNSSSSSPSSASTSASSAKSSSAKGKGHIKLPRNGTSHEMKNKKSNISKGIPNPYKDKKNMTNSNSSCNDSPWRKSKPLVQGSSKEEAAFVDLYSDSHLDSQDPCAALDAYSSNEVILDLQELQSKLKNLSNHIVNGSKTSLDYCNHNNYDDIDECHHHQYGLLMPSSPISNEDYNNCDSDSYGKNSVSKNLEIFTDEHITMKEKLNVHRNCSSLVSSPCHSPRSLKRQSSSSSITNPTRHAIIHHSNDIISTNPNASHSCVIVKDPMPQGLHITNYTRFKQQQLIDKAPWKVLDVSEKLYDLESAQQITSEPLPDLASTTNRRSTMSCPNMIRSRSTDDPNTITTRATTRRKYRASTASNAKQINAAHHDMASSMCSRDVYRHIDSLVTTNNLPARCMRDTNRHRRHHREHTVRSFEKKKLVKVAPSPWPCGGNDFFHNAISSHEPKRKSCDDGYVNACQEDHPLGTQSIYSGKVLGQTYGPHRVRKGRAVGNRGRYNYLKYKVHVGRARGRVANGPGCAEPPAIVTGNYEQLLLEQQKQLKLEQPNQLLKQQDLPQQEELEEEESDLLLKASSLYRSVSASTVAMVKCSDDPHNDFKESMMEMIDAGRGVIIKESSDLVELLRCYLSLNSRHYHDTIVDVFVDLWSHHLHLSPR